MIDRIAGACSRVTVPGDRKSRTAEKELHL